MEIIIKEEIIDTSNLLREEISNWFNITMQTMQQDVMANEGKQKKKT